MRPLDAFNEYASRPPSRVRQVVIVVLVFALTVAVWNKHGAAVGLLALVVYGSVFGGAALFHERSVRWSAEHRWLDGLVVIPIFFLGLAYLTALSLLSCLLIALAAWAALSAFRLATTR